jgi:hypothetical protein
MEDGLLKGWVIELHGEMIQDSDQAGDFSGREGDWIGWKNQKCQFCIYEINKIFLEVYVGSAGRDVLEKKSSICFPASNFSCHSRCAEGVVQVGWNPPFPLHSTTSTHRMLSLLLASLYQPASTYL